MKTALAVFLLLSAVSFARAEESKISVPQSDLSVTVDGFRITPAMGLTAWIAFSSEKGHAMAMGDVVVLEDEAGPVEREALAQGFAVTALHNHFLRDTPKVMYMHVEGMGPLDELKAKAQKILDRVKALRSAKNLQSGPVDVPSSLEQGALDKVLGAQGNLSSGVLKYVFGRPDVKLKEKRMAVSTSMGFNTWAAFQGTMDKAAVAGDFAMVSSEVQDVIKALTSGGLEVTAIHNHMIGEEPRIVFLHYWGVGRAEDLARALKAALGKTGHGAR